jgi:arylsulfatase A
VRAKARTQPLLWAASFALLSLFLLSLARTQLGDPETVELHPSILVVVLDDIGEYEFATIDLPTIDAMAAEGISFERARTIASVCSPSRMVLCGEYGRRRGIGAIVKPLEAHDLSADVPTLADKLAAEDYATGFFGKWHLSKASVAAEAPQQSGFEVARAVATHNLFLQLSDGSGPGNYTNWDRIDDGVLSIETEYATAAQTDALIAWWQATEGPKFAWLALSAAHEPFDTPPAEFLPPPPPPPGHALSLRERYELSIEAIDNRLAHLFASIDTSGAFVFLWSDNGTPKNVVLNQDPAKVKGSGYEGGIATPLIAVPPTSWPWQGSGSPVALRRRLVSTIDLHDTILELAHALQGNGTNDSVSFANELGPYFGEGLRDWVFAETFEPNGPGPYTERERVVADRFDYKLLVREEAGVEVFRALYELPDESTPVADPVKEAELQAILDGI